jgi:hypothetical protein
MRSLSIVALVVTFAFGCEKAGAPKPAGTLQGDEAAMLAQLPKDTLVVFGGNYHKVQQFMANSAMAKFMSAMDSMAPGMKKWAECFTERKNLTMLGGVSLAPDTQIHLRFVMRGFDLDAVAKCAQTAGLPVTTDPDKKYIAIEMQAAQFGSFKTGYLVLPDGSLYARQTMGPEIAQGKLVAVDRAALEADIAALAAGTAASNAALHAIIAKSDRSKTMWFAGSVAGTPIGDKVGEITGTIDIESGIAFDATVQIKDAVLADKLMTGLQQAKQAGPQLGPEIKAFLDSLQLTKTGDRLRFVMKVTSAQIEAMLKAAAPFMGGGAPRQ